MNELREVKNRHQFSLDNRQIVLLVSGVILVLMLSFLMGSLFGLNLNRMEGDEPALAAADPADTTDLGLADLGQNSEPAVAALEPGMDAEVIEPGPERPLDLDPESRQNLIADLVSQRPGHGPANLPDSVADVISKANAQEALPPVSPVMAAKAPARDQPAGLGEQDLTKAPAKPAPAPTAAPAPAARVAPAAEGAYTIQLASVPGRVEAESLVNDLRSKRYDAYLLQVNLPDKGTFYRIRVGHYKDLDQAKKALVIIQSREGRFFDAWITQ